jgi:hypothetical protein
LADLDADIEGKPRYQQVRTGKSRLLFEHVGEPEAVHQDSPVMIHRWLTLAPMMFSIAI